MKKCSICNDVVLDSEQLNHFKSEHPEECLLIMGNMNKMKEYFESFPVLRK